MTGTTLMRIATATVLVAIFLAGPVGNLNAADPEVALATGVRGLVTRAAGGVEMDGSLREWGTAFCTPVHYNHGLLEERAAQFRYQWDAEALYIGLRCLDTRRANPGQGGAVYNGDAVEFYLDTRSGEALRSKDWTPGAVHFFYSPFDGSDLSPRWVMRQGIATSVPPLKDVEIAATVKPWGYECEVKIPWSNFPNFQPKPGALLAMDAELCSGDGAARTDRTFAYGSPLSVQQPASLGLVELVEAFDPAYLPQAGPSAFPMWVETPWNQPDRGQCMAVVAIPPAFLDVVGQVEIRIHDADGKVVKTIPAPIEPFGPPELHFARAVARWSIDDFAPNMYFASAKISARTGKPMVTVTPRMVQEGILSGR